jgi:hypothetical protein
LNRVPVHYLKDVVVKCSDYSGFPVELEPVAFARSVTNCS